MEKYLDFVLKNKIWVFAEIIGILAGIGVGMVISQNIHEPVEIDDVEAAEIVEEPVCEVFVDLSGAVAVPGVYCLSSSSILYELIQEAGGFTENMCELWVDKELNRAQLLENGLKIYIPSENDEECGVKSNEIEQETVDSGKVSINNGTKEQLETLTGIGPTIAKSIIDGRPYSRLEDIKNAKGIGEATYEKIKGEIGL